MLVDEGVAHDGEEPPLQIRVLSEFVLISKGFQHRVLNKV
jgi:hypothetical protein